MHRLVITRRAEADLREIWVYTFNTWGEAQADRYLDQLDAVLQRCRVSPRDGQQRDAVRPGYWSRLARRHVIFYTFDDRQAIIQRVLHGRMDPDIHILGE